MTRLNNKVALVTGGSRGIGAAIVKRLAAEGASVAFTYISSPEKAAELVTSIEKDGGKALAIKADSGDPASIASAVEQTVKSWGQLDILVNNAGLFAMGSVDSPDNNISTFDRQYAVNVNGVAAAVRAATKYLGFGGRVISIGSSVADTVPFQGMADYAATKAAVATYSRGWARDLGAKGITVNTVQPGPIDTDMNPDNGDFAAAIKSQVPLGRYGKVEEVAAAVAFLASPEASYITGTTLNVDGGQTA